MAGEPAAPRVGRAVRADIAAWLLLAFGVAVRIREYLAARSLWGDEAALALNLIQRDMAGLLKPLDYWQMAPPGYLWMVKGVISSAPPNELALRVVALTAGVIVCVAGWWLARTLFGPRAGAAAMAIMALSPGAIYYSNEVKPYSSDACIAAVLLIAGWRATVRELTWRRVIWLGVLGGAAVWASYPAPFTLAGVGLAVAAASMPRRDWPTALKLAVLCGVWVASWAAMYLLVRQGPNVAYMHQSWETEFLDLHMDLSYRTANSLVQLLDLPMQMFRSPLDPWSSAPRITAVLLALLAIGVSAMIRYQRIPLLMLLVTAPVATGAAAAAHLYPLDSRLLLFLLPCVAVLASGGLWYLGDQGAGQMATVLIAVTLSWFLLTDLQVLRSPVDREDALGVLAVLKSEARPGDTIYVWNGKASALGFYQMTRPADWPRGVDTIWAEGSTPARHDITIETRQHLGEIEGLRGRPRVWVAVTHIFPPAVYDGVIAALRSRGAIVSSRTFDGAAVTLLNLRAAS